jgi:pimeloyl-ACP methyl ester carboxylesterase
VTRSLVERYLRLGLELGRHVEGVVDAYYGPPELADAVDAEPPVDPRSLVSAAELLLDELEDGWLRDQVVGLRSYAGALAGESGSYADEVEGCFGVRPAYTDEAVFAAAHERTPEFGRFVATAEVDRSNRDSVIEYLVDYSRILAGGERAFDETRVRELVRRDIERARDFAAVLNHNLMSHGEGSPKPLSSITSPTLVIHGTADPMFPIEHGEALAEEIRGARLLRLEGAGHGVDRADWEVVVEAILEHT